MDEEVFNMSLRKFLKKLGITAQREIEGAVRAALADGRLSGDGPLPAKARVTLEGLDVEIVVESEIALR